MGKSRTISRFTGSGLSVWKVFALLLAAFACAFALSFAFDASAAVDATGDVFAGPQIAWADEASDDQADDAEDAEAAEDEQAVEEIEDDEVPLAMARSMGNNLRYFIIGGFVLVVVAFLILNHRLKRNVDRMHGFFR